MLHDPLKPTCSLKPGSVSSPFSPEPCRFNLRPSRNGVLYITAVGNGHALSWDTSSLACFPLVGCPGWSSRVAGTVLHEGNHKAGTVAGDVAHEKPCPTPTLRAENNVRPKDI